jgi:gliding motility-associated-like protein
MKTATSKFVTSFIILVFLSFITALQAKAQFWVEEFEPANTILGNDANGYNGLNGIWTVTDISTGTDANKFFVSCTEAGMQPGNCGDACPVVPQPPPTPYIYQSLHIGTLPVIVCPFGDCGASYNAGDGGLGFFDCTTDTRAESPNIDCSLQSNINLSFSYIEFGDASNDNAEVWYFDGITWTLLSDMPKTSCGDGTGGPCNPVVCNGSVQGFWTAFSIALPASANFNANVKIGFRWVNNNDAVGTDPSFAVTKIELTGSAAANTITAGNLIGPFCAGGTASLPFSSTGTFNAGNNYTVIMSDAFGSFASPTILGTLTSTANVGNIPLSFLANTPAGTGYLIQIVSDAPAASSQILGPFTIEVPVPLSVTTTPNPGTTICAGECVTFSTNVVNGGAAPTYQWQINGANATGTSTNDTYNSCALQNGDVVTVIVTSNLTCVSNSPATSAAQTMVVNPTQAFSASLTTVPTPFIICAGDPISLTANTVNGGAAPTYAWTVNGTVIPTATSQTLNYTGSPVAIVDGTVVCAIVTTSLTGCVSNSPDTVCSTVTVVAGTPPIVSITADTSAICVGGTVTFNSSVINGGTNPSYQWYVSGNPVPGPTGTDTSFTTNTLVAGDVVTLVVSSSSNCLTTPTDTSNAIIIDILPFLTPEIDILPTTGLCPGQLVTFTSNQTGGGNNPQYQWLLNDTTILGTSGSLTVNAANFQNGDTLNCILTSSYLCLLQDTAVSNDYTIDLLAPATLDLGPDVEILYGESYKTDPQINGVVSQGNYLWTPDSTLNCNICFNPTATPTITTDYVMQYRNSFGCIARDTIKVDVKPNYEVFIPSGFSPNNDNSNDIFYVRGPYIKSVNMKIWDRLGGVIFESQYAYYGWDGTSRYKDVNTGIYVYYITVQFLDGVTKEFKGNITLSR